MIIVKMIQAIVLVYFQIYLILDNYLKIMMLNNYVHKLFKY